MGGKETARYKDESLLKKNRYMLQIAWNGFLEAYRNIMAGESKILYKKGKR